MIKNDRQYKITKTQVSKFKDAIRKLDSNLYEDPLLRKIEKDALESQLEELESQVKEYDELRAGKKSAITVNSFDKLPEALVQARIASGLTQKELADRLGVKMQQIQRYESTDYASASFSRMKEIVDILGLKVRKEFYLPTKKQM